MTTKIFPCPYCKDVFFFNEKDLNRHLMAGVVKPVPVNVPAINEADHLRYYRHIHARLEGFSSREF